MGSGPCVLAIDGGSQSTKVSVFDARGVLRASAQRALRPYASPGPGRWEHPDDDLWDSLAATVRAVLTAFADAGGDAAEIVGVGLCTIRFCRAVLREDGSLAQPVMSWMDERLSRPHSAAESPADARYLTTSSGYLGFRLTGERRDTAGNAQGVWPVDSERWTWSADPEAFVRTGMPREMLFDLVAPGTILGGVTAAAAAATGLPEGLPVVATSNDKAVEALGAGLRELDRALISLGTYVSGMTLSERAEPPLSEAWVNFGAEPGRYLVECAGVRRGMWTVSWFRELLGAGREPGAAPSEAELGREAESVPPGSGGLIVSLDWLAPSDAPERRGAIVGFDGTQGRGHVFRAILEALAVTVGGSCRTLVEAQGRELREVVVTGGGAASELMLRILAAVFERPVRRPGIADAAGVGAAVSAAVAIGLHPDWDAAVAAMVRPGLLVEPEPELVEAYRAVRADYERVIPRVRELFA